MKYIFVLLTLLFCNTIIYGQSIHDKKQEERIKAAEKFFKSGEYDQAISKYKEYSENVESEEKTIINKKIAEIKECKKTQEATEFLYKRKAYTGALLLYAKLLEKSPESDHLRKRIFDCSKHVDNNNDSTEIKLSLEIINLIESLVKDGNYHDKQQKEMLQLILDELRQMFNSIIALGNTQDNNFQMLKNAFDSLEQKINNILVQPPNSGYNYLPFGIHQFANKQIGKGLLFSGMEIGLLGTGIGYSISAYSNLKKHKSNEYEQLERDGFYSKYENQRKTSFWLYGAAGVAIFLNYCDNFHWFRKNNIELVSIPTFDYQGRLQMTMNLSIKF
jgi:hypothetical protein